MMPMMLKDDQTASTSGTRLEVLRDRKNLLIEGQRTTISLERSIWDGLVDICRREEMSLDDLCDSIAVRRGDASISSALRMAALLYFRAVVDERDSWTSPLLSALNRLEAGTEPGPTRFGRAARHA